ncbi:hypothetical protein [Streptococcus himalayensis]|uniref:Uncharacterized protein n=1 Tax=Streptococcus himalayensis TaxID=1888195 RepID=A0A917A6I4_9STRE|nr:hypothetical protein [Streptococcus himalayensis]GGE26216.1 hypothetical protein GCM10011510_04210 [Streptococcus himalayensis]
MKTIGKVILLLVFVPLVIPLGFIAIMLDPFLDIILEEKNNDSSK